MADSYDRYENEGSGGGFMMGLLTGTVLGAGLGMLLAPKAGSELRGAIGEQARNWSSTASEQYRHAREAAGGWADRGREFVNQAREAVSKGVDDARGYAGSATGNTYGSNTGNTGSTGSSYGSTSGSNYGNTSGNYGGTQGGDFNRS
jgi:gas vesicle protein